MFKVIVEEIDDVTGLVVNSNVLTYPHLELKEEKGVDYASFPGSIVVEPEVNGYQRCKILLWAKGLSYADFQTGRQLLVHDRYKFR